MFGIKEYTYTELCMYIDSETLSQSTPIHFINDKCQIKQLRSNQSHTVYITLYHAASYYNALGDRHTHTHIPTHKAIKAISRNQVHVWTCGRHAPGLNSNTCSN